MNVEEWFSASAVILSKCVKRDNSATTVWANGTNVCGE